MQYYCVISHCWKMLTSHGQEEWSQLCIHLCQQGLLQQKVRIQETASEMYVTHVSKLQAALEKLVIVACLI